MFSIVKQFLPHSLFGRFLLITLVPVILVQLITAYVFYQRHWSSVTRHMTASLVGDIEMLAESMDAVTPAERQQLIKIANQTLYLQANFLEGGVLSNTQLPDGDVASEAMAERFESLSLDDYQLYVIENEEVVLLIQTETGVLKVAAPSKRVQNPTTYIFILWMSGSAIFLALISVMFIRNQIRSIAKLSDAAEQFGRGQEVGYFKPTGALEVRKASRAFIKMKERIQKQVSQRTEMLAGISHDLKTPITRIKLQLAMMPQNDDIKALQDDLQQMEHMVQEYLDFAKGHEQPEPKPVNVADFMRSIGASYRKQSEHITIEVQQGIISPMHEPSMRRAVTNIIDNALRYGTNVKINVSREGKRVRMIFDDDGAGISPAHYEQVFKPFSRLEASRNVDKGGAGLGLAITRDAIIRHGGAITLDESPMGGLRVLVTLPL